MKKITAMFLALLMLLASVPAMAAAPTLDLLFAETPIDVPMNGNATVIDVIYGGSTYDIYYFWPDENGELQYDNSATDQVDGETWHFTPLGNDSWTQEKWENVGVQPWVAYVNGEFGKVAIEWYSTYIEKNGEPYVRLSVNPWEMDEDGNLREVVLEDGEGFLDQNKDAMEDIIDQGGKEPEPTVYEAKWYPHNTICVAGVEFRDVRPELTSKWYNFAAIDLSTDGVQTYDLVASNMYIIGTVTVTKTGDEVTVDWELRRQGTNDANFMLEDEFLTIFSDLNAVAEVEPSKFEGPTYEFGQPISIANDLNGDTNVLLYICNQATYCNNLSYKHLNPIYHARYWPNLEYRIAEREAMMDMVNADLAE